MSPTRGSPEKDPAQWDGRCYQHLPFLLCFKIRRFRTFGKSPSPDEVANCAVHRADFTNNRR